MREADSDGVARRVAVVLGSFLRGERPAWNVWLSVLAFVFWLLFAVVFRSWIAAALAGLSVIGTPFAWNRRSGAPSRSEARPSPRPWPEDP
jgi:hypothetical protein